MSLHLPNSLTKTAAPESGSESSESDNDQEFGDWVSDTADQQPCRSLFDEKILPNVLAALSHDKSVHGFDLETASSNLSLDFHQRIRLINYIRKEKPLPVTMINLNGTEPFLAEDRYLIPVLEDDPFLQFDSSKDWSDSDDDDVAHEPSNLQAALHRIKNLEKRLLQAKQELSDYRTFVGEQLNITGLSQAIAEETISSQSATAAARDDDSHYFQSYGENEIHAIMIQDSVRTSTYASYILRNPQLFRDAVVLDVGCGTGILSLFAARAGAKRVFAVDASPVVEKAELIVKANELEDIITVIRGKIEDITLPFPEGHTHVDIIISEWMGYALLYESMLDSVLVARDRFLRPSAPIEQRTENDRIGIMAPSQTKIMFGLCDGNDIYKERIAFWNDVHGFDLSVMASNIYEDAVIDVVTPESMVSDPVVLKDIFIPTATTHSLSFSTPFSLVSTSPRRDTRVRAFCLYFDTFFTTDGSSVAPDAQVQLAREDDLHLAEVWPLGTGLGRRRSSQPHPVSPVLEPLTPPKPGMPRKPSLKHVASGNKQTVEEKAPSSPPAHRRRASLGDGLVNKTASFSTGPWSIPTHWKQTLFLLREPIFVEEGTIVSGTFYLRKSSENKRELDVEIHYEVTHPVDSSGDIDRPKRKSQKGTTIQMFKVR